MSLLHFSVFLGEHVAYPYNRPLVLRAITWKLFITYIMLSLFYTLRAHTSSDCQKPWLQKSFVWPLRVSLNRIPNSLYLASAWAVRQTLVMQVTWPLTTNHSKTPRVLLWIVMFCYDYTIGMYNKSHEKLVQTRRILV